MTRAAIAPIVPRLIDEESAAAYLGRSRTAFRTQRAKGLLPAPSDKNGNIPLWDMKILDRFIDAKSGLAAPSNSWGD